MAALRACLRRISTSSSLSSSLSSLSLSSWSPPLTSEQYPELRRGDYGLVSAEHIDALSSMMDEQGVIVADKNDPQPLEAHNVDWMRIVRGQSRVLLRPRSSEEVSRILAYCNQHRLAVCPQGGNTGLVGGSVPVFDELILSMARMNAILDVDLKSSSVSVEAGVVLENLDAFLANHKLIVPLDLGAKGSCQLGGNLATNAGGLRQVRYSNLHAHVLGLEVVLADGEVLDLMRARVKKDNTGYDLKHLFLGSEGTLGVITKLALNCPVRPNSLNLCILALQSFDHVLETLGKAKESLGEILSSIELIDHQSMMCVTQNLNLNCPIDNSHPFFLIIETAGANSKHDKEKLEWLLSSLMDSSTVLDGTVATSETQMKSMWQLRERLAEALLKDGYCYKYDISLPMEHFYSWQLMHSIHIVETMRERLGSDCVRCVGYGHLGDGNLHLNITSRKYDDRLFKRIEPFLFQYTSNCGGSISAEHGLGLKKRNFVHFSKSEGAVHWMKRLKRLFDPQGILNPYKVLPDSDNTNNPK